MENIVIKDIDERKERYKEQFKESYLRFLNKKTWDFEKVIYGYIKKLSELLKESNLPEGDIKNISKRIDELKKFIANIREIKKYYTGLIKEKLEEKPLSERYKIYDYLKDLSGIKEEAWRMYIRIKDDIEQKKIAKSLNNKEVFDMDILEKARKSLDFSHDGSDGSMYIPLPTNLDYEALALDYARKSLGKDDIQDRVEDIKRLKILAIAKGLQRGEKVIKKLNLNKENDKLEIIAKSIKEEIKKNYNKLSTKSQVIANQIKFLRFMSDEIIRGQILLKTFSKKKLEQDYKETRNDFIKTLEKIYIFEKKLDNYQKYGLLSEAEKEQFSEKLEALGTKFATSWQDIKKKYLIKYGEGNFKEAEKQLQRLKKTISVAKNYFYPIKRRVKKLIDERKAKE